MIEVNTLSFRLRLEKNDNQIESCAGNYFYVLFCESPFDVSKTFSEEILSDFNAAPFHYFSDAARFAEEMACFWEKQITDNPKLDITRLEELTDLWRLLSSRIEPIRKDVETAELELVS